MADQRHNIKCSSCLKQRTVTRSMLYLIKIGKNSGNCRSCASKGNKARLGSICSVATKEKMKQKKLGVKKSSQHCINISNAKTGVKMPQISGSKHYLWIKDRTQIKKQVERNNPNDKQWKYSVYKRDNYKCRIADKNCNGRIEAHHILSWRDYPELRDEVNNGITLCHFHHPRKRNDEMKLSPYFQELVKNVILWQIKKSQN